MSVLPNCTCDPLDAMMGNFNPKCNRHLGVRSLMVSVPRELLLRAAALLSERAPCADPECRLTDSDDEVIRCYNELCAAARQNSFRNATPSEGDR
jgi:hypothetical protein